MPLTPNVIPSGTVLLPASGVVDEVAKVLQAENMESAFARFAPGFYFNAYGGTQVAAFTASRSTQAHSGTGSQKFEVTNKFGGNVELIARHPFEFGRIYRATVWARADVSTPTRIYLRRDEHPWTAFATRDVTLGPTWQKVELEGIYPSATASGSLRFNILGAAGAIYVDDYRLEEIRRNEMLPASMAPVPSTLFGMHVNRLGSHQIWPGMLTSIIRLWNTGTTWRDLERSQGVWDFGRCDMFVDYAARNGAAVLLTLGQTPAWAATDPKSVGLYGPGANSPPRDVADWRDYVRTLARRYAGRVRYWELWNEPDFAGTSAGPVAGLVEMARIAKEELAAADPANRLISPGYTVGQGMPALDAFLRAGGGAHCDIIGFHWYYGLDVEAIAPSIDNVRGIMKTHGQAAKPLWNTEGAFVCDPAQRPCDAPVTIEESRSANARAMFIMAAKGIGNFNFHVWEAQDSYRKLVEPDFVTQTPAGAAFAEARAWLSGAAVVDAYQVGQIFCLRLRRGSVDSFALWSTAPAAVMLPHEWGVTTIDRLTGPAEPIAASRMLELGLEPVLLTA